MTIDILALLRVPSGFLRLIMSLIYDVACSEDECVPLTNVGGYFGSFDQNNDHVV